MGIISLTDLFICVKESLFSLQYSCGCYPRVKRRCLSSSVTALSPGSSEQRADGKVSNGSELHAQLGHRAKEKLADKVSRANISFMAKVRTDRSGT